MSTGEIRHPEIKRPFQLLAVWITGQIALTIAFLTAAGQIKEPQWLPFVLVLGAIVIDIVFAVLVFLMQTRYREQMSSDKTWLRIRQLQVSAPISREYEERFEAEQQRIREIIPERNILLETRFGKAKFDVLQDNIVNSTADVLVSSDDNHLQARGGVAKAILDAAGSSVSNELLQRRMHRLRQGKIAVTGGGNLNCRAIVHPAVIDLDENRYPDETTIKSIVRASIQFAISLGASRIAFPIIGGGTASKGLTPSESVRTIILEIAEALSQQAEHACNGLTYVALYVFDKSALADMDLSELVRVKPTESGDDKKA